MAAELRVIALAWQKMETWGRGPAMRWSSLLTTAGARVDQAFVDQQRLERFDAQCQLRG
jgi:hypothetical protein